MRGRRRGLTRRAHTQASAVPRPPRDAGPACERARPTLSGKGRTRLSLTLVTARAAAPVEPAPRRAGSNRHGTRCTGLWRGAPLRHGELEKGCGGRAAGWPPTTHFPIRYVQLRGGESRGIVLGWCSCYGGALRQACVPGRPVTALPLDSGLVEQASSAASPQALPLERGTVWQCDSKSAS